MEAVEDILRSEDSEALWVLPGSVLQTPVARSSGDGYVAFTSRGMLETLRLMPPDAPFLIGVDAKVGQSVKAWRTATVCLFVKGELRRTTLVRDKEEVCECARPVGHPTHIFANYGLQLPKKSKDTCNTERISWGIRLFGYHCPTVDMLDILLRTFLPECQNELGEAEAVQYITQQGYVSEVSRETLSLWHVPANSTSRSKFAFCTAWQGAFAVYPGTACGNQPVEAFHGSWQRTLLGLGGADRVATSLHTLARLYREDGTFKPRCQMGVTIAGTPNPDLLHGEALRRAGLSPAVDYWRHRDRGNHHIVAVGAKRILAIQDGKAPAESVLEVELADRAAQSLFEADDGLRRSLYVFGVLEDRPEKPAKVSL